MEQQELRIEEGFSRREWLLLFALAAILAVPCWTFREAWFSRPPGLLTALMVLGIEGMAVWYFGRANARRGLPSAILAFDALLALTFAIYANPIMRWLNLIWIAATLPAALFLRAGHGEGEGPGALFEGSARALVAALSNWGAPFRAAGDVSRGGERRFRGVLLGLFLALPVIALAGILLSSADAVFGEMAFAILRGIFGDPPTLSLARLGALLVLLLPAFSCLRALRGDPAMPQPRRNLRAPASALRLPLLMLNALYALFVYVQFRYLFGGAEAAAMTGGYAEYARSGFFELAFLSGLNLCVFGLAGYLCPGQLRGHLWALLLATAVVLASAARRMGLYMEEYGLSTLRILTLWGMAAVAMSLLAAAWKLVRPPAKVFRYLLIGWMATWLLLNGIGVDRTIARRNAEGYLAGTLKRADVGYLSELSTGAYGALKMLSDAGAPGAGDAAAKMELRMAAQMPWTEWSLHK